MLKLFVFSTYTNLNRLQRCFNLFKLIYCKNNRIGNDDRCVEDNNSTIRSIETNRYSPSVHPYPGWNTELPEPQSKLMRECINCRTRTQNGHKSC